jgi:hypothetical protein
MTLHGHLQAARDWLSESGYDIVHTSGTAGFSAYWDKEVLQENLVADFIVRKFGKYYAVIVRADESHSDKEQIFQSWFPIYSAFAVHGILEINIHTEHIREIDFDISPPRFVFLRRVLQRTIWFLSGIACAIMVMYRQ